jgi:hypothetical protein
MRFLILLFFCAISLSCLAQTEASIRKYYIEVNKKIAESAEQGFEGPLYQNQLVVNKNGKSWPAVGNYADTTNFWYDDDPNHLPATERNPKNVLLKVNINRKASHLSTQEEYLFKDGKLLFYYCYQAEEGNVWETRVYYNNKSQLIKTSVKANDKALTSQDFTKEEYKDFKPNTTTILANGKNYQDLFIKSM